LKTTSANLEAFLKEIPWDTIPRTIQDAINVCRMLDIQYLWVDALCILQDSEVDKHGQIAGMASIYEDSWVTLSADVSETCAHGMYLITGQNSIQLTTDPEIFCFEDVTPVNWIDQRAWTFQELRLSRRVIRFGATFADFTCHTARYVKSSWQSRPETEWKLMLFDYSSRKLTFQSDKLLAIAALVERLQAFRPQELYMAGIWSGRLEHDLTWYTREPGPDPETKVAPSWSWASVNSRIEYGKVKTHDAKFQVSYTSDGPHHLGRYTTASLLLRSLVLPASSLFACLSHDSDPIAAILDTRLDHSNSNFHSEMNDSSGFILVYLGETYVLSRGWKPLLLILRMLDSTLEHREVLYERVGVLILGTSLIYGKDRALFKLAAEKEVIVV
jgi:hypothetical protein